MLKKLCLRDQFRVTDVMDIDKIKIFILEQIASLSSSHQKFTGELV